MKINDSNYIKLLSLKNEKALEYVIDVYGGLMKAVIRNHLGAIGSEQDIEECMNDVFIGIWKNISYYDPNKSSFKNWAAGIAKYKALDYLKKGLAYQSRNQEIQSDFPQYDSELEKIIESHLSDETEALLQCLTPKDRELFRKIYIEDKPVDLVSKETGIKKETIYSRISRSRKKLKNKAIFPERSRP